MNLNELNKTHQKILNNLLNYNLVDAFDKLSVLIKKTQNGVFTDRLQVFKDTYKNMLKFSFQGTSEDPQKDKIYTNLIKNIVELSDEVKEYYLFQNKLISTPNIPPFQFSENVLDAHISQEKINALFYYIWLTNNLTEESITFLKNMATDKNIPYHIKCIIISALTMNLIRTFNINSFNMLFIFIDHHENQVWQRAYVGLLVCLYIHKDRLHLYPEISNRLKAYQEDKEMERVLEIILTQFARSKETEEINKKLRDEILPEVMKLRPKLENKLDLENLFSQNTEEDKNPEWENFFKDTPGLYDKLEEFSKLQAEGSDVFWSTFSMMKHFSFFQSITNWFIPFHGENPLLTELGKDIQEEKGVEKFKEGLLKTGFMCNSDKYSFCLNMNYIPSQQRKMILEMFTREINAMEELEKEDEILNQTKKDKLIVTQYIQDLFRFYKLYPLRKEFPDIFKLPFDLYNYDFFNDLIDNQTVRRNIAEFYFERNSYTEALDIFLQLESASSDFELLEKIGFAYQQSGEFTKALDYYKKAELYDKNRYWLHTKIAHCHRKLENYHESLTYLLNLEKEDPENLAIQGNIGQVYLDAKDFENALKYYYKVEYNDPKNTRVLRPIAWCSFMLDKYDSAKKYFLKVIDKHSNKHDHINLGHVQWCMGDIEGTIHSYLNSLNASKNDIIWFEEEYREDSKYLLPKGIKEIDLNLMLDLIKLKLKDQ